MTVRCTQAQAQANLLAVLQLCAAGKLRCSEKTRRPSAATVRTVTEALLDGDFYDGEAIAAFAWPLLLQAGGLAELAGGRLRLTARGTSALGKPPHQTIKQLWKRWIGHGLIDEFSRVDAIKGQRAAGALSAVSPRRKTVGAALAGCEAGAWIGVDDLFGTMRRCGLNPTVARNDRAVWKLYLEDPEYGSLGYDGFHDWPILEGRYTLAVLFEYAGSLGLIDLDYGPPVNACDDYHGNWGADGIDALSPYDGLHAIRLNALGAYAVGASDAYHPPEPSADVGLKVLPNLDIVATGQIAPAEPVTQFATPTGVPGSVFTRRRAIASDPAVAG